MVAPKNCPYFSEFSGDKNGADISQSMFNYIRTDNNDCYNKGFLTGFIREIEQRTVLRIKKEEKKKKENDINLNEVKLRRLISEVISNEVDNKLEVIKRDIEFEKDDRIKLKHELDDQKNKNEEINNMVEKNIAVKMNEGQNNQNEDKEDERDIHEQIVIKEEAKD